MKKSILFFVLLTFITVSSQAQSILDKVKKTANTTSAVASTAGIDVKAVANNLVSKLTTSLALKPIQKPQVLTTVTSFLQQKSSIINLATTDKAQYVSKLAGLTTGLNTKMKGILTSAQYTKFLDLKPAQPSSTNVLSQLFY